MKKDASQSRNKIIPSISERIQSEFPCKCAYYSQFLPSGVMWTETVVSKQQVMYLKQNTLSSQQNLKFMQPEALL
jgi:hypothetical protein